MALEVLILDDDEDELIIFEDILSDFPYEIHCSYVSSAEEVFGFLKNNIPDIIFLDVNMPKINGIECLSAIHRQDRLKSVPVVINSNGVNKNITNLAESLGAAACFKKTGDFVKMKQALLEILDKGFRARIF